MVFFCQRNCYTTELVSTVLACTPSKIDSYVEGKKQNVICYEVIFEDTIFFPEGGGQPYDTGYIDNIPVIKVLRRGHNAIHYMFKALDVGSKATQILNWERRYDHMQQHTGQHLITAVADKEYNFTTLSWNLGEKISSIELDTPNITEDQLHQLEDCVNEIIRKHIPVLTEEFEATDPKLKEVRTRGLPDDVEGPVRVVTIKDLDSNMCCGTHVSNLSDLQAIKFLFCEKGKGKKTLLYFIAGNRMLKYLEDCVSREKKLNRILHCNPSEHVNLVEKCKKDMKQCMKSLSDSFKDLAQLEAFKFNQLSPKPKLFFHHRRDGNADYLGQIISSISDDTVMKVLTAGEDPGPGVLIIHGNPDDVNAVSSRVCEILVGKGGGKTRFMAKISKPSKRKEAEKYVKDTLPHLTA